MLAAVREAVLLGAAISAYTTDIAMAYMLGENYGSLGREDFGTGVAEMLLMSGVAWRVAKRLSWLKNLAMLVTAWAWA